jgi:electron transport complex protein RnfA
VSEQILILIGAGLASNLVLDHMLGVDPVVAVSRSIRPATNLALLMLLVLPVTTTGASLLNSLVLIPYDLAWLQITATVLITPVLILLMTGLTARIRPALYARIELYVPILLVNCSVFGVALLDSRHPYEPVNSLFFGLGSAIGFGIVILLISAIRERIAVADVPVRFQGMAILLITLGLMSMAFMGFNGFGSLR